LAYLEIKGINKTFTGKQVLKDINFSVDKSNFVSLLGLSGCGKTTLLRIIAGLENTDSGTILLDGKDITNLPANQRNIGIVFQNYALFSHMTVFENIAYGLKIKKNKKSEIQYKVDQVLEKVQLVGKTKQNVSLLSGGEQQRVALARAIVTEPQIILLDEPLSNLDYSLRLQARRELKRLQNDIGVTTLYVTHDQSEALSISDRIFLMSEGNILQAGSPRDIYYHPTNFFTGDFVGHYNFFSHKEAAAFFDTDISDTTMLAILPEHLSMKHTKADTGLLVREKLFNGALTEYILTTEKHMLKVLVSTNSLLAFHIGETVSLQALPAHFKIIVTNA
jgi:ABC-type Fe3+/spermidine/putrescine transport system ATPase subunit